MPDPDAHEKAPDRANSKVSGVVAGWGVPEPANAPNRLSGPDDKKGRVDRARNPETRREREA
jgi:hypothetical protein